MAQNQRSWRQLSGSGAANSGVLPDTGTVYFPSEAGLPLIGTSLQIKGSWTGDPTGEFVLETDFGDGDWAEAPGSAAEFTANDQAQPAGDDGSAIWNWQFVPGTKWRLAYTASSGDGVFTATVVQV